MSHPVAAAGRCRSRRQLARSARHGSRPRPCGVALTACAAAARLRRLGFRRSTPPPPGRRRSTPAPAPLAAAAPRRRRRRAAAPVAVKAEAVVAGLSSPWSLAFLPDGSMLVTERTGSLRRITAAGQVSPPLAGVPAGRCSRPGRPARRGPQPRLRQRPDDLLHLSPSLPATARAGPRSPGPNSAKPALSNLAVIYRQTPARPGTIHYGSRLVFDRDGLPLRDAGRARRAGSRPGSRDDAGQGGPDPAGRQHPGGQPGLRAARRGAGHLELRPPQSAGRGAQPGDRRVVGQRARAARRRRDQPRPGRGATTAGRASPTAATTTPACRWAKARRRRTWSRRCTTGCRCRSRRPAWLSTPATSCPGWQGSLLVGTLAGQMLAKLTLEGDAVVGETRHLQSLGERIRDVRQGPDGYPYLLTDSGRLMRVVPQ